MENQRVAFVLTGGGAKGAFQVGVMQSLYGKGIRPDVIYGTSVGALNAAGYAYQGVIGLEKIWKSISSRSDILKLNWWKLLWAEGIYSTSPLKKLINKTISGSPSAEAVACSVDYERGKIRYTSNKSVSRDEFKEQVLASASIPVVMDLVNGWMDGGVREIGPLSIAVKEGARKVYVISANPINEDPSYESMPNGFFKIAKIAYRVIDGILEHEIFINDMKVCKAMADDVEFHVYAPDQLVIDTLEFNQKKILKAMEQGRLTKAIEGLP